MLSQPGFTMALTGAEQFASQWIRQMGKPEYQKLSSTLVCQALSCLCFFKLLHTKLQIVNI